MNPQSIYDPGFAPYGGGSSSTVLHPLVIGAVILIALLTFLLPRRFILIPLFLGLLLIPSGQNWYISGTHLYVSRMLILFGLGRLLCTKFFSQEPLFPGGFTTLDKLFLVWALYRALAVVLVFRTMGAVPYQISFLWQALGGYFLFRWLIQDDEDLLRLVKVFAVVAAVTAVGMIYEQMTKQNLFAFLGGIRLAPEIRNGRIRSQGIFQHALLAGSYGAMTFPLFLWLWKRGKSWFFPIIGAVSSMIIVYAASTSTPLLSLMGVGLALLLWPIRSYMRVLRWGIVISLIGLQLVMKAPVWFVISHIDLSGGSTGWDRSMLIDNLFRHFGDWWLIGTNNNMNWGYDMWDSCNQFVAEGVTGGLVCLVTFIAMVVLCFRLIGNARKAVEGDRSKEWLFWFFGAAMFAQVLNYFGIDYFDQMQFVWYAFLVMILVVTMRPGEVVAPVRNAHTYPNPIFGVRRPATVGVSGESRGYLPTSRGSLRQSLTAKS